MTQPYPHQQRQPEPQAHQPALTGYVQAEPVPMVSGQLAPATVLVPQKSAAAAVVLELILGLLGIFGVGNLYAGRTTAGVILMLSFWGLFWINLFLIFLVIGIVTMPLTWIAYLIVGPLLAAQGVEQHNARAVTGHAHF